jgi:large subunit ribosomal protein L3
MSNGMIGKKLGMTGVFSSDGRYIPVTVIEVGPCVVTQVKTQDADGYNALQVGFGERRRSRINKPAAGHLKKSGGAAFAVLREFKVADPESYALGQTLTVDMFAVGERVNVSGTMKGRGFTGVVRRHNKSRGRKTHGSHSYRAPGSIGCSATPSRVTKGKKMPGHYGDSKITVKNLVIVDIRPDENLLLVKGAVPGAPSGLVAIQRPKHAI